MQKTLNKCLAVFITISVVALNIGLVNRTFAAAVIDPENSDQQLSLPIERQPSNVPAVEEPKTEIQTPAFTTNNSGNGGKVTICHFTSADHKNGHTIEVNFNALAAHLDHGDTTGNCPAPTDRCAALIQNIKNFQGVQANITAGTYDPDFDLNGDNVIDQSDVTIATNAQPAPDANGDGKVNLTDLALAMRCIAENPHVPTFCEAQLQNIKIFQAVKANILAGTYDAAYDLNHDGFINLSDVTIASNAVPSPDVSHDGQVNLTDIALAAQCKDERTTAPVLDQPEVVQPQVGDDSITGLGQAVNCAKLAENIGIAEHIQVDLDNRVYEAIYDLNHDNVVDQGDLDVVFETYTPQPDLDHNGYVNLTDVVLAAQSCQNVVLQVLDQPEVVAIHGNDSENGNEVTNTPPTEAYCHILFNNMKLVLNANHSVPGDFNGDGSVNLTDAALGAQLDRGGPNGKPDGIVNLTDVALLAQYCQAHLPIEDNNQPVTPPLDQTNNGGGSGASYYLIPTPPIQPQVLGEQVTACSGDADIIGKTSFANGTLLRSCESSAIYVIKDGKKFHIETLKELQSKLYRGKRIYNVSQDVLDSYANWTPKVLGIKPNTGSKIVKASVKVIK